MTQILEAEWTGSFSDEAKVKIARCGGNNLDKGKTEERRSGVGWRGSKEQMIIYCKDHWITVGGQLMGGLSLFSSVIAQAFSAQFLFSFVVRRSPLIGDLLGPKFGPEHAIRGNERARNVGGIRSVEPCCFLEAYKTSWVTLDGPKFVSLLVPPFPSLNAGWTRRR